MRLLIALILSSVFAFGQQQNQREAGLLANYSTGSSIVNATPCIPLISQCLTIPRCSSGTVIGGVGFRFFSSIPNMPFELLWSNVAVPGAAVTAGGQSFDIGFDAFTNTPIWSGTTQPSIPSNSVFFSGNPGCPLQVAVQAYVLDPSFVDGVRLSGGALVVR